MKFQFPLPNAPRRLMRADWSEATRLIALAAPMTGAALVNMGMTVTDTVMIGRLGPAALAAGTVVSDAHSIIFYLMAGILAALSPLVARATGAGDSAGVAKTMRHGLIVAGLTAIPTFTAVWHAPDLVRLVGVEPTVVHLGRGYAQAIAFASVAMLLVTVWRNLFDAIGRPRIYLMAIATALPLNAIANQLLIFGWGPVPALGLTGAGIASALVAFGLLLGFVIFSARNYEVARLRLFQGPWRPDPGLLLGIFRLGVPIGLFTLGEVGVFLLATVIVSRFGVDALAAHAVTIRVAGVIYAIPLGLSQATTVSVSQAIGSADVARLARSITTARLVGAMSGFLILTVMVLISSRIPELFVVDGLSDLARTVAGLMVMLGLLNLAQGFAAPATAILRGFKETRMPMVLCLTAYWLIGLPVAYLSAFQFELGVHGIWAGLTLGVAATALFMNARLAWRSPMATLCPTTG